MNSNKLKDFKLAQTICSQIKHASALLKRWEKSNVDYDVITSVGSRLILVAC